MIRNTGHCGGRVTGAAAILSVLSFATFTLPLAHGAELARDSQAQPDAQDDGSTATKMNEVAEELRRIADAYGPDSVALQAKFLLRSAAAGALGPTEVKVAGPSATLGDDYLQIVVDTGLFFEEQAGTAQDRADQIWNRLAAPALEEMTSFNVKPAGLEVVFLYRVQDLRASVTGALDPSIAGRAERLSVALNRDLLSSLARDEVVGDALRRAVRFDASASAQ